DFTGALVSDHNVWYSPNGSYQFWREFTSGSSTYWTSLTEWQQGMNVDASSLAADPRLDAADLYTPLADSPAIDAGETLAEVTDDYSGISRPQGVAYDIGAHEHATTVLPAPSGLAVVAAFANRI